MSNGLTGQAVCRARLQAERQLVEAGDKLHRWKSEGLRKLVAYFELPTRLECMGWTGAARAAAEERAARVGCVPGASGSARAHAGLDG